MPVRYNPRALPRQRRPVRNLLRTILHVLEKARRPLSETELTTALILYYHRIDPEFQRQVHCNLRDAVTYGILKRQVNVFSMRCKRLAELTALLVPKKY